MNELRKLLLEQSKEHFKMQLQRNLGEASKPHQLKGVRRDIARINTIINEKERQA